MNPWIELTINRRKAYINVGTVSAVLPDESKKDKGSIICCDPPLDILAVDECPEVVYELLIGAFEDDEDEEDEEVEDDDEDCGCLLDESWLDEDPADAAFYIKFQEGLARIQEEAKG
jgi:hypothetical protein